MRRPTQKTTQKTKTTTQTRILERTKTTMPSFIFSQALTANQIGFNPLTGWQFQRVPNAFRAGAYVAVLQRATTTGVRASIFSGSQNIQQRSPVQGGGTAGVTPSPLNTPVIDFQAAPDDLLSILDDEVAGGTPTVDGIITIEPL